MNDLPHKLKLEVSLYIHETTYKKIFLFKGKPSSFIAWICPLLKPLPHPDRQYIYFEGDEVSNIYFLTRGKAGFVLPKYKNTSYIDIIQGSYFGIIDIVGSILQTKHDLDNWIAHKDILQRQFTVMALKESEVMCLSIQDLNRMKQEFLEVYEQIFFDSYNRLRRALTIKLKTMQICAAIQEKSMKTSMRSLDIERASVIDSRTPNNIANDVDSENRGGGDDLDYQIAPIQLNKIDEESVEVTEEELKSITESSFPGTSKTPTASNLPKDESSGTM